MAIVWIREIPQGRQATFEPERSEYVRVFLVRVDRIGVGAAAASADPAIAQLFNTWRSGAPTVVTEDTDDTAQANRIDVVQDGQNPLLYRVTVHFTTALGPIDQYSTNPLLRPPQVEWGFRNVTRIADKAYDPATQQRTKNVLNSAGDAFDPPIEYDDAYQTAKVTINEASFGPQLAAAYRGTINDRPFVRFARHCARLVDIRARKELDAGTIFYPTTYEFEFRDETWDAQPLDQGFHDIFGAVERRVLVDKTGAPFQQPQLLDGLGFVLPVGGTPVYLTYQIYEQKNFDPLGLAVYLL